MENNYTTYAENAVETSEKKVHVPSLVLMIFGALFSLLLPIVTYVCSIISIVLCRKNSSTHKTGFIMAINIIALVLAVINSALGVMLQTGMLTLG